MWGVGVAGEKKECRLQERVMGGIGLEVRRMGLEGRRSDCWIVIVGRGGGSDTSEHLTLRLSVWCFLFIYLEGSPVAAFYHL